MIELAIFNDFIQNDEKQNAFKKYTSVEEKASCERLDPSMIIWN